MGRIRFPAISLFLLTAFLFFVGNLDASLVAGQASAQTFKKLTPPIGSEAVENSPLFSWEPAPGAEDYFLAVYDTFENKYIHEGVIGTPTQKQISLRPCRKYTWQARAHLADRTLEADGGQWWWFTTTCNTQITVNTDRVIKTLNRNLFGTNAVLTEENNQLFDEKSNSIPPPVKDALSGLSFPIVRLGGTDANYFHWYQTIGPKSQRIPQKSASSHPYWPSDFGLTELMAFLSQTGVRNITLTVNFPHHNSDCSGTPLQAAKWVEYMNAPAPRPQNNWTTDDYKGEYIAAVLDEPISKTQTIFRVRNNRGLKSVCPNNMVRIGSEWVRITRITKNDSTTDTLEVERHVFSPWEKHAAGEQIGWWDYSTLEKMPPGYFAWLRSQPDYGNRIEPYSVTYWELGNENLDAEFWKAENPEKESFKLVEDYARNVPSFANEMKTVDPSIKLGAPSKGHIWGFDTISYKMEHRLLEKAGNYIDFIALHLYAPGIAPDDLDPEYVDFESVARGVPYAAQKRLRDAKQHILDAKTGGHIDKNHNLSLAVTEWNVFYGENEYSRRHIGDLGSALNIAHMLKVFIEEDVELAEFFTTRGWFWSLVEFPFSERTGWVPEYDQLYKRGGYFVFDLFRNHFGTRIIDSRVAESPLFDTPSCSSSAWYNNLIPGKDSVTWCGFVEPMENLPFIESVASKDGAGSVYLMVINKHPKKQIKSAIEFTGALPSSVEKIQVVSLQGDSLDARNSAEQRNALRLTNAALPFNASFQYFFPAHSITVFKLKQGKGKSIADEVLNWRKLWARGETGADANGDGRANVLDYLEILREWLNP